MIPTRGRKHIFPTGRFQLKIALSYIAIIILMLALLNTYPIYISQQLIFRAKHTALLNSASSIASSLSNLDTLTLNKVKSVMDLLGTQDMSRIVVADADGLVVFDTALSDSVLGKYTMQPEIFQALSLKDFFYSRFTGGAFESRAATPVINRGSVLGAVYLYEYDAEQAGLLQSLQSNVSRISMTIALVVVMLSVIVSTALSRRLSELLRGIRLVREGEYNHRVPKRGKDELADLSDEFNALTGRLQKTEASRRRFVADASHELKTPLASIRLLTDSILQTDNIGGDTIREFVSDIGEESDRLSRLTEKLLTLTRLDAEVFEPVRVLDVKAIVTRAAGRLEPLAALDGVELSLNMNDNCLIRANEDGLYQIVFNLLENAIKYNRRGGTARVLLFNHDDYVVLIVEDTGVGIPEEELPRVFERFYRVDKARSREAGGAGLGLSIVKDTLQRYHGSIKLESTPDKGTRVTARFPLNREEQA